MAGTTRVALLTLSAAGLMSAGCPVTVPAVVDLSSDTAGQTTRPAYSLSVSVIVNPSGGGDMDGGYSPSGYSDGILEGKIAIRRAQVEYGSVSNWQWTKVDGPQVELRGDKTQSISFVAPEVNQDTQISFQVVATSSDGSSGSAQAVLTIYDTATASFTAPAVADTTTLAFEVTATDAVGRTCTATTSMTIQALPKPDPKITVSSGGWYGGATEVTPWGRVTLTGEGGCSATSYHWTQDPNTQPTLNLIPNGEKEVSFTAPCVTSYQLARINFTATDQKDVTFTPLSAGHCVVSVKVTDSCGLSGSASYEFDVNE